MTTFKSVEPAIFELLKNTVDDEKVYRLAAPPNAKGPYIVYQKVDSNNFGKNVLNRVPGQAGTVQAYIQIDCYAEQSDTASTLGKSVEYILDGYDGTVYHGTNSPQEFVEIGGTSYQNDADLVDRTDEPILFRNSAVYLLTYNQ